MNIERISVIELANIIGKSDILIPYNNQERTPTVKMMNIDSEISLYFSFYKPLKPEVKMRP